MTKKLLRNKSLWITVIFVAVFIIAASSSYAIGEQIESSLRRLLNWVTRVLGGFAVAFGIVFTGIRISMGDEHAFKKGGMIVGGGILIFSAMWIVDLLRAIFQG